MTQKVALTCCVDLPSWGMDGEAQLLPGALSHHRQLERKAMGTEVLERRFAAIGARLNVVGPPAGAPRIDVGSDARGEFFDVRFVGSGHPVELEVVDVNRTDRHLLLLVRDGEEKSKFLCGHDERHWFVAAVPLAYRRGGQVMWVNRRHPSGISDASYRRLNEKELRSGGWTRFVRD